MWKYRQYAAMGFASLVFMGWILVSWAMDVLGRTGY